MLAFLVIGEKVPAPTDALLVEDSGPSVIDADGNGNDQTDRSGDN
jgi:hypothetical protein